MNIIRNYIVILILAVISLYGFRAIPMTYHIPVTDVNSEAYYVWLAWFVDHIADDNDTLNFEIASHGGSVVYGSRLVTAIIETDSKTVAKVKSGAYSMGGLLTIVCDEIQMSEYTEIMFHKARYSSMMGPIVVDNVIVDPVIEKYAFKYLTEGEIAAYKAGKDIEMPGKEFMVRYNIVNKHKMSVADYIAIYKKQLIEASESIPTVLHHLEEEREAN